MEIPPVNLCRCPVTSAIKMCFLVWHVTQGLHWLRNCCTLARRAKISGQEFQEFVFTPLLWNSLWDPEYVPCTLHLVYNWGYYPLFIFTELLGSGQQVPGCGRTSTVDLSGQVLKPEQELTDLPFSYSIWMSPEHSLIKTHTHAQHLLCSSRNTSNRNLKSIVWRDNVACRD